MDLIDLMQARSERDKAIQKVSLNNDSFMSRALDCIQDLKDLPGEFFGRHCEFTGEQIRLYLTLCKIIPAHSNAYGALVMTAVKRGLIVPTGRYTSMKSRSSHARKTAVYRWA